MRCDNLKRPALPPGTVLGAYQIEREAGRGSDFIMYRAFHRADKSNYLIKEYFPRRLFQRTVIQRDTTGAIRFTTLSTEQERDKYSAQIKKNTLHDCLLLSNITRRTNARRFISQWSTSSYLAIRSNADICLKDYQFPVRHFATERVIDKLSVFTYICKAVSNVHHSGIIHCGLEPENIYISTADSSANITIVNYQYSMAVGPYARSDIISQWNAYSSPYSGREIAMLRETHSDEEFHEIIELLGPHTDVYSLLIILLQMLSDQEQLSYLLSYYDLRTNPDIQALPENIQSKLLDLFARGFGTVRTRKRLLPDTTVLLHHINSLIDDIQQLA